MAPQNHIFLSDSEMEEVKAIAKLEGTSINEAASKYAQGTIAHRYVRNTGKTPAKVYDIKRKKKS